MPNRLAGATSPYLLQHQDNPVDWWEWGDDAFRAARQRDLPVLLSVGYASCHWCHVMAHESFEDPAIADVMNRHFVNIKVDREERPDVDGIYMEAVQAMTGRGGWPMTVFLDHDGRPFFAGTYFPPVPRHGMPSFAQVLEAIQDAWTEHRDQIEDQATRLVAAVTSTIPPGDVPDEESLASAYAAIEAGFDRIHGGFGGAPKFPQQPVLEFLLRIRERPWAPEADRMVSQTLLEMAAGGIHDQLGGGFSRYSVDERWLVPHFEKMLYDNAQLARLYLWAGQETGRTDFLDIARSTFAYMARDLRGPEGGFFSAEDADSEGVEGKFYVWTADEMREVLGDAAGPVMAFYGVTEAGDFEGANVLNRVGVEAPPGLDEANAKLLDMRSRRVRPALDDKVVTSWHGMALRAFAEGGAALADAGLIDIAREGARFAMDRLFSNGVLQRSWRAGRTSGHAFVDDHASLALGLFSLYAATGEEEWFTTALDLTRRMERFTRDEGGFYTTPEDGERLLKRPFDVTDNPTPSGNAMAAEAMLLAHLYTGEERWKAMAESAIAAAGRLRENYPTMVAHHLSVADAMTRAIELAIVGEGWERLATVHYSRFRPHVALAPATVAGDVVPLLDGRTPAADGSPRAFVCRGFVCEMPVTDPGALAGQLAS